MKYYFGIPYEFDRNKTLHIIRERIASNESAYICVVDGVVLANCQIDYNYKSILSNSLLNICDSGYIPMYIRLLYGEKYSSTAGEWLFLELIKSKGVKMAFIGSTALILSDLEKRMLMTEHSMDNMLFSELPFCNIDDFDYLYIADMLNRFNADIIWVSLGAPKQEQFIATLSKYVTRGILIAVGAVFGYQSGNSKYRRAPKFIISCKLEFLYRLFQDPKKQWKRCCLIIRTLPKIFFNELTNRMNTK